MLDRNNFGFDNIDSTYRYYDNTVYRLTDMGIKTIENYIQELKAKRKEILDAGKDTVNETNLPTVSEIFCDAMDMEYECSGNSVISSGEIVGNGWGVTDNYDADYPIGLEIGKDIEIVCRDTLKERLTYALINEKMNGFITHSFEEAQNNSRRKNIVLLEDGIYITFKANTEKENSIFGELICWVEDEFEEDESIYQTAINAVIDLFTYSDEELNQHIIDDDLIETFTRYDNGNTLDDEQDERDKI